MIPGIWRNSCYPAILKIKESDDDIKRIYGLAEYLGIHKSVEMASREIFQKELGHPPKYALDIVSYFPELANQADGYLDRLEQLQASSDG